MNIGLLNTRITVQKNEVSVDSIGNHKNVWTDWYSCAATVSGEAGKEDTDAGLIVDDSKGGLHDTLVQKGRGDHIHGIQSHV